MATWIRKADTHPFPVHSDAGTYVLEATREVLSSVKLCDMEKDWEIRKSTFTSISISSFGMCCKSCSVDFQCQAGRLDGCLCVWKDMSSKTLDISGHMGFGGQVRELWEVVMLPRKSGIHTRSFLVVLRLHGFSYPFTFLKSFMLGGIHHFVHEGHNYLLASPQKYQAAIGTFIFRVFLFWGELLWVIIKARASQN